MGKEVRIEKSGNLSASVLINGGGLKARKMDLDHPAHQNPMPQPQAPITTPLHL